MKSPNSEISKKEKYLTELATYRGRIERAINRLNIEEVEKHEKITSHFRWLRKIKERELLAIQNQASQLLLEIRTLEKKI